MRVPTYANYMSMAAAIRQNKNNVDQYSYQSVSGLKHQNYSEYAMQAYNIVSMESTLKVTNTFKENNELANVSLNTANLALQTITESLTTLKSTLTDCYSFDLAKLSPDETGGELTFLSDTTNDYHNKTITIKGTTYTFKNDGTTGARIVDISTATSAQDVMQKLVATAGYTEMSYQDGKISFPLYTIDGESTLLTSANASSVVKTGEAHKMSPENALALENLQKLAFSTMSLIADTLNTNVAGKYIFGGGASTEPVSFKYASLTEFQNYYDGKNTVYPSSASATLSHFAVDYSKTKDITFVQTGDNQGIIKADALEGGSFLEESIVMNASNVGTLRFEHASNTMKATQYGAFSSLHEGDMIVINGSAAGGNARKFVVESISADGRTVTFDSSSVVADAGPVVPNSNIVLNKTFPIGSVINLNGFNDVNLAPTATVTGISDDGTQLYVNVDTSRFGGSSVGVSKWSIVAETYYQGGSLEYNQRISESQTISFDIKASDPAFEKIFRALGQIAQGNIVDTSDPLKGESFDANRTARLLEEAMMLLASATNGDGDVSQAQNYSIYSITAKLNADYTILNKVTENQKLAIYNLENNISKIKDADKEEAAVKLLMAQDALTASYSILSSVSKLSLLDYIR